MSALSQYFTPAWAAERLVEIYFGHLGNHDTVIEPTCGTGAFLAAIPPHVPAFGVEIDPDLAALARRNSGRAVYEADILEFRPPTDVTAVIGNPPFRARLVRDVLELAHDWLPDGGLCGMILPAYLFQSARPAMELGRRWRVQADHIPRDLFPGLTKPLVFATLRRGGALMVGFSLYDEFVDVAGLADRYQQALREPRARPWRVVVTEALRTLGGVADLSDLYAAIEPKRPSGNPWWREKVRQVAARHFERVGPARYAIADAA